MDKSNYWVISYLRGVYHAEGPYRTEQGAWNRYNKTKGGEVFLWKSWYGEGEHEKVVDEFKSEQYKGEVV